MLASKALPEMEAANASLLADVQARYKGSLEAAYEPLSSAEDAHNALVRFLTVSGGRGGSGVLDAKVVEKPCEDFLNTACDHRTDTHCQCGCRKK